VAASVAATGAGFELELDEPAYGVASGQAAVLYEGDAVVGCGLVTSGGGQ
jgi:tRNA U34 2-thiouridine synthase MnmA/TrmU